MARSLLGLAPDTHIASGARRDCGTGVAGLFTSSGGWRPASRTMSESIAPTADGPGRPVRGRRQELGWAGPEPQRTLSTLVRRQRKRDRFWALSTSASRCFAASLRHRRNRGSEVDPHPGDLGDRDAGHWADRGLVAHPAARGGRRLPSGADRQGGVRLLGTILGLRAETIRSDGPDRRFAGSSGTSTPP
jgi:hypothetical protein